jgi:hypothetical protein
MSKHPAKAPSTARTFSSERAVRAVLERGPARLRRWSVAELVAQAMARPTGAAPPSRATQRWQPLAMR